MLLAAAPAPEVMAELARTWFDDPAAADAAIATLYAEHPDDDDVAWWYAKARLPGSPEAALAALADRRGRNIPPSRFAWLRAQARALADPAAARVDIAEALAGSAFPRDPEWEWMVALATWLDLRAGEDSAREAAGPFRRWSAPPAPLVVEVGGEALAVGVTGLAYPYEAVSLAIVEGPGPDLFGPNGARCLAHPATRFDPAPDGSGWLYVAGADAPEGPGIHRLAACGSPPVVEREGYGLASPARFGGVLAYLRDGTLFVGDRPTSHRGLLRVAAGPEGLLVVLAEGGLRLLRSPGGPLVAVFAEDPPITRAAWWPSPAAPPSPGPPPLPPRHRR